MFIESSICRRDRQGRHFLPSEGTDLGVCNPRAGQRLYAHCQGTNTQLGPMTTPRYSDTGERQHAVRRDKLRRWRFNVTL